MRLRHGLILMVVVLVGLTGCLHGAQGQGQNQTSADGGERTVGVAVGLSEADQQSLQTLQQDLLRQVQQGNLTRQEAQRRIQQEQSRAISNSTDAVRSAIESSGVEVVDSSTSGGAPILLVQGSPGELIDLLEQERVQGLLSRDAAEQAIQQSQQPTSPSPSQPSSP